MPWSKLSGPRAYSSRGTADIDGGWAYTLERDGAERTVHVEVAGGRMGSDEIGADGKRAITTKGWSAIEPHLDQDEPPTRIVIATGGLYPSYE